MNMLSLLLIALGGAAGSVARALAAQAIPAGRLPWATIAVNIAGSVLIGVLMARFAGGVTDSTRAHAFWVVGVCGGFTTFSTFSWQTFEHLLKGHWAAAIMNILLSLALCLAGTWLGWRLAR